MKYSPFEFKNHVTIFNLHGDAIYFFGNEEECCRRVFIGGLYVCPQQTDIVVRLAPIEHKCIYLYSFFLSFFCYSRVVDLHFSSL